MHTHLNIGPIHNCSAQLCFFVAAFLPSDNHECNFPASGRYTELGRSFRFRMLILSGSYLDEQESEMHQLCEPKPRGIIKTKGRYSYKTLRTKQSISSQVVNCAFFLVALMPNIVPSLPSPLPHSRTIMRTKSLRSQ